MAAVEENRLVDSFLDIAVGESIETARLFLNSSNWRLEDALQLFYDNNDDGVSPPLPATREVLNGHDAHAQLHRRSTSNRTFSVWESEEATTTSSSGQSSQPGLSRLSSLYQPPSALLFDGSFHMAVDEAKYEEKWLLVNVQSVEEFSSHMLNRDTWADEVVAETIKSHFVFWQVDEEESQGRKVSTYYKLSSFPHTLVIDPVTGEKKKSWKGYIEPSALLEDLLPFADRGPCEQYKFLLDKRHKIQDEASVPIGATSDGWGNYDSNQDDDDHDNEDNQEQKVEVKEEQEDDETRLLMEFKEYPCLPEEPKGSCDMICRVRIRLPDGHRVQRSFYKTDPIQFLWSYCNSELTEDQRNQSFRLIQAIPGASRSFEYDQSLTLDEAGLANAMLSLAMD